VIDQAHFTAADLDRIEDQLRTGMRRVAEARWQVSLGRVPETRRGAHCRYCPAQRTCPAHVTALAALAGGDLLGLTAKAAALPAMVAALRGEDLARAWDVLDVLLPALEAAKDAARAQISLGQVTRADGSSLRVQEQSRDSTDGVLTEQVLSQTYGAAVAAAAVTHEPRATKEGIQAATDALVRAAHAAGKASGSKEALPAVRERLVWRPLRQAGALKSSTYPKVVTVPAPASGATVEAAAKEIA
jgi:hypothetical protein